MLALFCHPLKSIQLVKIRDNIPGKVWEKTAVKSLSLQIIIHLLIYQFWTTERERNSNHWAAEIITFRVQLENKLTTDLSKFLELELENIYENARLIAEKKTGLKNLPIICPYSLRQILEKQWFPDTDNQ